jgi:hypothetical protein
LAAEVCTNKAGTPVTDHDPNYPALCTSLEKCNKAGKASFAFSFFATMLAFAAVYACWQRRKINAMTASDQNMSPADFSALVLSSKLRVTVLSVLVGVCTVIAYGVMQVCGNGLVDFFGIEGRENIHNNSPPFWLNVSSVPSTGGQLSIISFTFSFLVGALSALSPVENAGLSTLESNLLKQEIVPSSM